MDFAEHLKKYLSSDEINKLITSFNDEDEHALLLNTKKVSKESFLNIFPNIIPHPIVKNGFLYNKEEYQFGKNYMHDAGVYYLQEPSAMIVAHLLNPNENDIVLDMCAAPGGKTIQSSLLMNNDGIIIANDLSYPRAKILSSNVERMGRKNVIVTSMDLHRLNHLFKGKFTKIILDAPCSGSGMFRKDPKFIEDWTYEKVLKCSQTQKELIDLAYELLKDDGTLVYSTCSYSYEENEEVIQYALNKYQNLEILDIEENKYFKTYQNLGIHLFPSIFKGEGHYICLLHKIGNPSSSTLPTIKSQTKLTKDLLNFLNQYNLNSNNIININNSIYLQPYNMDLSNISTLRIGLKICEINKNNIVPDYALSHYLDSSNSIELTEVQKDMYLHGETFSIDKKLSNGYYIVSYNRINLGFVKYVDGILKNHYPKGLRH
ncbi:MAG: NOL1/NOP2/sun family putative RNA methylase [Bacilli bacterium]